MANLFAQLARALIVHLSAVKFHFSALYIQADPLDASKFASQKVLKLQNWIPIFILTYVPLYGIFGLQYEAFGQVWDWTSLASSPVVFTHQIVPRSIWTLIDIGIGIDVVCAIPIFAVKLIVPSLRENVQIRFNNENQIVFGTKVLSAGETSEIMRKRKIIKSIFLNLLPFLLWLIFATYFQFVVLFVNRMYSTSILSIIFWAAFPLFMYYIIFGLFGSVVYIILASVYIQVHQKSLLRKMKAQNGHLNSISVNSVCPPEPCEQAQFHAHWSLFKGINLDILETCKVIKEFERHCAPMLSIVIPFYITLQCYLICIVLFADGVPMKEFFAFDVAEINLFLFVITNQCAAVAKLNQKLELQNRKFHLVFMRKCNSANKILYLQTEKLQIHRRLHSYVFRVLGNYRITGKSYYLIVSYISTFFMFVAKEY